MMLTLTELEMQWHSICIFNRMKQNYLNSDIEIFPDILCFSHLRWNFVFQRPQHIMSRFANVCRVFFIEELQSTDSADAYLEVTIPDHNIFIINCFVPVNTNQAEASDLYSQLLETYFSACKLEQYIFWYYSPMFLELLPAFQPVSIVYDCMDELSAFKFAPLDILIREKELLSKASIVFTGGKSLFAAKKDLHFNIHCFPSSIDKDFFHPARSFTIDPKDQKEIAHPRLGFFGVIDERFDIDLLTELANAKPEWNFILIGPIVKIDPESLPKNANIHYLGLKDFKLLPQYIAGWDISFLPFALNESTKYISPTKTPEYLAAGKPVISTNINDVNSTYGHLELVKIINNTHEFIQAAEHFLTLDNIDLAIGHADKLLAKSSWNKTWFLMNALIQKTIIQQMSEDAYYSISNN